MAAKFLVSYPCNDACCEVMTGHTMEGAPVYRCPGCDSEWIELGERQRSVGTDVVDKAVPPSPPRG